jgi:hypothetical protein
MMTSGGQSAKVNPDGTFLFRNLAPAEYHLNVRTAATPERAAEAANVLVSVVGGDIEGINIVTSAAGSVAGWVVVEGNTPLPAPIAKLLVRALPVERETAINLGGIPDNGRVRDDGGFELKSVAGQVRLSIATLADGWAIRQIDHNGRDITTQPFDTQGQTLDGVTITLTNRFPVVSGALRDDKGNAVVDGTAILFPDDPSMWSEDLRAIRSARVDQSGLFTLKGIRPGDYLIVAVNTVRNNQWNDPEYLESLREQASRISLAEGEAKQADLVVRSLNSQ